MKLLNLYSLSFPLADSLAQALTAPACQPGAAPNQTILNQVSTANTITLPGNPFSVIYAAQPGFAFVSLNSNTTSLGVLNTTTFPPTLLYNVILNNTNLDNRGAFGLALAKDGKYLFVSASSGAYIIDTSKAVKGSDTSVVGILHGKPNITGVDAIEVTLTHDGSYAFVSQEYGPRTRTGPGNIDVFELDYHFKKDRVSSKQIGHIDLGGAVVGSALSPDGKLLYVTSEATFTNHTSAGLAPSGQHGILSVLNVSLLTTHPKRAQIANVTAGCNPVREIVSSDGKYVWVTARASNRLLGYNASALIHDPANTLIASVQVGTLPVGLTFVNDGKYILTADSNRFGAPGAYTGLSVVDVNAALNGSNSSVIGYIPTGLFPREFATSPDNKTLLVADFSSRLVEAIDLSTLP